LRKKLEERFQSARDLAFDLEEALAEPEATPSARVTQRAARRERRRISLWAIGSAVTAALIAGAAVWILRPSATPQPVVRFRMGVQPAERLGGTLRAERSSYGLERPSRTALALSPDGRRLVFNGGKEGKWQLYLRSLDEPEASPIPGTERAVAPFFSPDGEWLGFWASLTEGGLRKGGLRKVAISGGLPVPVCETPIVFGASWGENDTIVFGQMDGGLMQVSADGGLPAKLTTLQEGEYAHRMPHLLPGGEAVLFTVQKRFMSLRDASVVVQSLTTGERHVLVEPGADARYVPTGHLLYAHWGTLMAVPFDLARLEVTGGSVPVVDDVMQAMRARSRWLDSGEAQFSVSRTGSLVYLNGGVFPDFEQPLLWVDREGKAEPLGAPLRSHWFPRLSPDGQLVATSVWELDQENDRRIWVFDISRGSFRPLTQGGVEDAPAWSRDGRHVVFGRIFGPSAGLFRQEVDGSGEQERLTTTNAGHAPCSWSPDGTELAYVHRGKGEVDIWVLPVGERGEQPRPVVKTPFSEQHPAFAPDGRWLAYTSDESGSAEVYVQSYPEPGTKKQVSVDGGGAPAWSRDGRELFFGVKNGQTGILRMMVVGVATEPALRFGKPTMLFEGRYGGVTGCASYDVTPDGRRFLMVGEGELPPHDPVTHINVVLNWFEELKRRVPVN